MSDPRSSIANAILEFLEEVYSNQTSQAVETYLAEQSITRRQLAASAITSMCPLSKAAVYSTWLATAL